MSQAALRFWTSLVVAILLPVQGTRLSPDSQRIWQHRNLGKAFYENPTTQRQAVEEFKKALDLAPDSGRERVNYGLALLRAGMTEQGVAELMRVQKEAPKIPHSWFNLGIVFKKQAAYGRALEQFEEMVRLVPDEPVSHYNLAVLYKLTDKPDLALKHFERASELDPNLAGPHFQLYNIYRQAGRLEDSARELKLFQEIRKRQAGAAIPEDLEWSFYSEIYEVIDPSNAVEETATAYEVKFQDDTLPVKLDPQTARLTVLDAQADGRPDLLAWSMQGALLLQNGRTALEDSGLQELKQPVSIAPGDINNDGLPDLCVITADSNVTLYLNKAGKFQKHTVLTSGKFARALWLDYDHDYDLDLFLLGETSALWRNNGSAGFNNQTAGFPFLPGRAIDGAVFDLTPDTTGMDLAVSYQDRAGIIYRDKLGGRYDPLPLEALSAGAHSLTAYDIDNDSWTDLALVEPSGISFLMNRQGTLQRLQPAELMQGPFIFADLENRSIGDCVAATGIYRNLGLARLAGPRAEAFPKPAALVESDFNGDGRIDIGTVALDGTMHLLTNQTMTPHHWLQISLQGVKSPKLAPGAEIEVKAGRHYQKKIYRGVPLLFGLNTNQEADTVRITWPNGLIQNEMKQPVRKLVVYKESPRLSGSCPTIFAWNGKGFEFISDVLGVAPLGASAGNGSYFPADHDEFVQIERDKLAESEGHYEIRITEELREVSYLDQVQLIAFDHPENVEIFINEKFKAPPFPEFRSFGVTRRIYPVSARDGRGHDVLASILRRDRSYPDTFERDLAGRAELHSLELDFGGAAPKKKMILVMNGWVDWPDGSTFLASSQDAGFVAPHLQVKDASGAWRTVIEDMGFPAGKPKTIVVDLSGKFLSDARQVRIVTNLCIYWDEIFLSEETVPPQSVMTTLDAASANLDFRGFSRLISDPNRKQPELFKYADTSSLSLWSPIPGLYTRFGDVRPLIMAADDCFVIMGSGDELRLRFDARGLPTLRSGWKRDFLLRVDGWAKDGDLNTAHSQSVEPLPFHAMPSYPYEAPSQFPADPLHNRYRQQYNTRPALRLFRPLIESSESFAARRKSR